MINLFCTNDYLKIELNMSKSSEHTQNNYFYANVQSNKDDRLRCKIKGLTFTHDLKVNLL